MTRKYYEAYDDRYRQIHRMDLQWFQEEPSPIVMEIIREFSVMPQHRLLEIGCGEGRDAGVLLERGYDLLATDISPEAIAYCQKKYSDFSERFQQLNCIGGVCDEKFDFIYAVAVVHMLVEDEDRDGFYSFIREHLKPEGMALICTMGDGTEEFRTDPQTAFDLKERSHTQSGRCEQVAGTSCRMVNLQTFRSELERNGLRIVKQGITAAEPDFPEMLYAVATE